MISPLEQNPHLWRKLHMRRLCNSSIAVIALSLLSLKGFSVNGENTENSIAPPGVLFELLALNGDLPTAAKPKYLSPTDIVASADSTKLYVAEQTAKRIDVVDLTTKAVTKRIMLPNEVTGIAVASSGATIYATCSSDCWPAGAVCEVDESSGKVVRRIAAGHGARSPVVSPDGKTLYVCNRFNDDVSVIDLASGFETARIPVVRQPYSAGVTPDGSVLVVVNSLPAEKATDTSHIACKISLIATDTWKVDTVALPLGSHAAYGLAISPDGNYAFVTHLIGFFTLPAINFGNGWIHTNNFGVIDIKGRKLLNDFTLDRPTRGSANPWGIACTKDSKILCVAHSGSNELSVVDYQKMIEFAKSDKQYYHNLIVSDSLRQRVPIIGKGPRALAITGNRAYTAGYFGDSLEVFNLTLNTTTSTETITLGPSPSLSACRKGEYYFYDATICYERWASCHSCHPFSRAGALNWTLNPANSAPKNTKSMLYSWWTPPTHWAGRRPRAGGPDGSIRMMISANLFIQPNEDIAVPIDTFFMNMKPMPSPYLKKGKLSPSAQRGKAIYASGQANCGNCHSGPLFTDLKFHFSGVTDPFDPNTQWDTPSLIEAWRTAPYGHIGSYDKIEDVVKLMGFNSSGTLSDDEFRDLVEYVLSL
jgi:YVTN family beta-propeller protein